MKNLYEDKSIDKLAYTMLLVNSVIFPLYMLVKDKFKNGTVDFVVKIVSLVGIMSVVHFATNRDFYLPFLGDTVFPTGLLGDNIVPNDSDLTIEVKIKPNTKLIYWAAEPCEGEECKTPVMAWHAYKEYKNSGIATSNNDGLATIRVRSPQHYKVPYKQSLLTPHVHYRTILNNGMLSRIHTK
jgi:hypothetical protein